jgi:hypothetical protein
MPFYPMWCYLSQFFTVFTQVGKALEHDSDAVSSLVEQNATMRAMWQVYFEAVVCKTINPL